MSNVNPLSSRRVEKPRFTTLLTSAWLTSAWLTSAWLTSAWLTVVLTGCPSEPPEDSPTPSDVPSLTTSPETSPSVSPTLPPEQSGTPSASPSETPTQTPGVTPSETPAETPTGTVTPELTPTATPAEPPTPTSTPGPTPEPDADQDGYSPADGDCNDAEATVYPGAQEIPYDGLDQSCDGADLIDVDQDGVTAAEAGGTDCNDTSQSSYPGAPEIGDGLDNDCDGKIDEGLNTTDDDGDGYSEASGDCNDEDASTAPGATEIPYDGVDQDCTGLDLKDVDGDGVEGGAEGTDCNDQNPDVNPNQAEVPYDGIDQDCSGADLTDVDGDGAAGGPGGADCQDGNPQIKPGASEICDGIDNNCDGIIDSDAVDRLSLHPDADGDGYGDASQTVLACSASTSLLVDGQDCNDQAVTINPAAAEKCDGLDNNCNMQTDEAVQTTYYQDADGDGHGDPSVSTQACSAPANFVASNDDCLDSNNTVYSGASEVCDGLDNNCDSQTDEGVKSTYYQDSDGDGHGNPSVSTQACSAPVGFVASNDDCLDSNNTVYSGASEVCDGLDNNCDSQTDEGVKSTYYQDADGDGHGNPNVSTQACSAPAGFVASNDDCADNNAALYGSCTSLPPLNGLVGFWKFDETSGTTAADASGLSNTGKVMSGVTRVTGKQGNGVQTKDGACVTVADSTSLSMVGATSLSYMAWIRYASPCNSDRGIILNKEHTYEMGIECATGDRFQEAIQLTDGSWFWTGATSVTRNQWAHVAVVWDGSKVTQYLNGVNVGTRNLTGSVGDRATGLGIGCRSVDATGTTPGGSYFNGTLDEVAVYNRALSVSEVLTYVNATR